MKVIDGMHRLSAAIRRDEKLIDIRFFDGTEAEAVVLSVELNSAHGLPLSLADRTAAANRIMIMQEQWSDSRIAAVVGLSASTVGEVRRRSTVQNIQLVGSVGRDGRVRPRDGARGRLHEGSDAAVHGCRQDPVAVADDLRPGCRIA
jgi:hypothetical protein